MPTIAIITTLKKGSKRFPNKNIKQFGNKPMYMWTVEYAKSLEYPYYVIHDYDNLELPEWVNECKINKPFDDNDYIRESIRQCEIKADIYILLQTTSPIRGITNIRNRISDFIEDNYDCGCAVHKIDTGYYYMNNKQLNYKYNERKYKNNYVESIYKECGSFFIFKKKQLKKKHILSSKKIMLIVDTAYCDIDTIEDMEEAKRRYKIEN